MAVDFGPLRTLIESEDISEVMVNSWNKIYVEHKGLLVETAARFVDQRQFDELVYSILTHDKKSFDSALFFDGILPNGFRYNITFPPMSPHGPSLTIRKFRIKNFHFDDMVHSDFISHQAAAFLEAAISARLNILISGGTGSGKTSFLNCLAGYISHDDRIVSIEDVAELRLQHPNWISLQSVKTDTQHVSVRDCLINALRMRPNRIIVGECRKDETFEMLQAMNTGHDGSMTTIHANSANEALNRIESLIAFSGIEIPIKHLRQQMSRSIDLVAQIRRRPNGKRELVDIIELTGVDHDVITRSSIFERNKAGQLVATGYVPRCLEKINLEKHRISPSFFSKSNIEKKTA